MRTLFIFGLFAFGLYYMSVGGTGIIRNIVGGSQSALVKAGITDEELMSTLGTYLESTFATFARDGFDMGAIQTVASDLNEDGKLDVIATLDADVACKDDGCMVTILMQDENGELRPVPMDRAAHAIKVLESITNGMHDLILDNDETLKMIWDGGGYVLSQN